MSAENIYIIQIPCMEKCPYKFNCFGQYKNNDPDCVKSIEDFGNIPQIDEKYPEICTKDDLICVKYPSGRLVSIGEGFAIVTAPSTKRRFSGRHK